MPPVRQPAIDAGHRLRCDRGLHDVVAFDEVVKSTLQNKRNAFTTTDFPLYPLKTDLLEIRGEMN